jgi:hypothetical protein
LAAAGAEHVLAAEGDAAGSGLDEAENHASQGGLAAARFADQPERFSLSDVERNAVHGANFTFGLAKHAFVSLVDLDEVANGEQGHGMNIEEKGVSRQAFCARFPGQTRNTANSGYARMVRGSTIRKIMALIARVAGEGIGPFRSFDFDFSDADGNPHPGPHIFAGVNGSGKSTVLRTLAWLLESSLKQGFPWQEWQHLLKGHSLSRAMIVVAIPGLGSFVWARTLDTTEGWLERLHQWVKPLLAAGKVDSLKGEVPIAGHTTWPTIDQSPEVSSLIGRQPRGSLRIGGEPLRSLEGRILIATYGPSRLLKHLPLVDLSVHLKSFDENSLSFEATVQNEAIQSWLLGLFSKNAIAKERGEKSPRYSAALARFENALTLMCGQKVAFSVDIEPSLQPRLLMYGKRLDFSQLPDGVRSTVGWLADFLMRTDETHPTQREDVLLLDEVDAHLHPKWQRLILPAIKDSLPRVQVFATSHSPFVIASCPGARVHVLELDDEGHASNRPPEDAPIGESILATMKDIFGVSSRFDVDTEKLLEEWNELRRSQANGKLSSEKKARLAELTQDLSSRSEELRQIVLPVVPISDSLVASLTEMNPAQDGAKDKNKKVR